MFPYYTVGGILLFILMIFWNSSTDIARYSAIIGVFALITTLAYEGAKTAQKNIERKKQLTIYKNNLLFKLNGLTHAPEWSLSTYLIYQIDINTQPNFMINNITLEKFQQNQFNSHKIYYEDIRYFSTSDIVPMEIKEKLDLINLDGEKLISFLPITAGKINGGIYFKYMLKLLFIAQWCLKDEDSDEIINGARNLINGIELLIDLRSNPKFKGFI
jgi:hypothetical protein